MVFGKSSDPAETATDSPKVPQASSGVSVIARGMKLAGHCETDGELRIDGHVTGNVRATRLTVGPGGRVDGDVGGSSDGGADRTVTVDGRVGGAITAHSIEVGPDGSVGSGLTAHEAVVRGHVKGAIQTEHRLLLEETAVVEGNVTAQRLGLKEGGQVFGTIRIGRRPGTGPDPGSA